MPDRITHHVARMKHRCHTCGGRIDEGDRMTTTLSGNFVTVTHETCTPTAVPPVIFGVVQDALRAAKELA